MTRVKKYVVKCLHSSCGKSVLFKAERVKNILEKLDGTKRYQLACGHNNAVIVNIWPFDTVVCTECGYKTKRIKEIK